MLMKDLLDNVRKKECVTERVIEMRICNHISKLYNSFISKVDVMSAAKVKIKELDRVRDEQESNEDLVIQAVDSVLDNTNSILINTFCDSNAVKHITVNVNNVTLNTANMSIQEILKIIESKLKNK